MPQWFVIENNKRRLYIEERGIDPATLVKWVAKWHALEVHCKQTGKPLALTFYSYIDLAVAAGILDHSMIGKKIDDYQLGRYGDQGGYSVTNCRFITKRENLAERKTSGATEKAIAKIKKSWTLRSTRCTIEKDGEVYKFNSLKECAEFIGGWSSGLCKSLETGHLYRGWKVARD